MLDSIFCCPKIIGHYESIVEPSESQKHCNQVKFDKIQVRFGLDQVRLGQVMSGYVRLCQVMSGYGNLCQVMSGYVLQLNG